MTKKIVICFIFLLISNFIYAQTRTTFQNFYPLPDYYPFMYCCEITNKNIILDINNDYLMQGDISFDIDNAYFFMYPIIFRISEEGNLNEILIIDTINECVSGFDAIMHNNIDKYYAIRNSAGYTDLLIYTTNDFDSEYSYIHPNIHSDTLFVFPKDLVKENDGYSIVGYSYTVSDQWDLHPYIAKYDFDDNLIWSCFISETEDCHLDEKIRCIKTTNGCYMVFKENLTVFVDSQGEILWQKAYVIHNADDPKVDVIEYTPNLFYRFYLDFNEDENDPYYPIHVEMFDESSEILDSLHINLNIHGYYSMHDLVSLKVLKTQDDHILIAINGQEGELHKFDSDFNHVWSKNYLSDQYYFLGQGTSPIIELDNGDLLLCEGKPSMVEDLVLIKTNSNGIVVSNSDVSQSNILKPILKAYPNPFKPAVAGRSSGTNISFNLPEESFVDLSIHNIKGQVVKTLVNDKLGKGNHTIEWNGKNSSGKNVANGIYFCRLKMRENSSVRKMLLLK